MTDLRRSLGLTLLERYVGQILAIVTMAVMARILTPAETGLFLVASSITLLAEGLRDVGTANYLVQVREATREAIRAAFTVGLAMSVVLGLALFLLAEPIATLYGDPRLAELIRIALVGFLIVPLGIPVLALLRRDMRFGVLAVINVTMAVANAGVTIGLGLLGTGPAAYVWGSVISNLIVTAIAVAIGPGAAVYVPILAGLRRVVSFAAVSTGTQLLTMAYDLFPKVVLGRILGLDAMAHLARAQGLCQLPDRVLASALWPIVMPAFAARARANADLAGDYLLGVTHMTAVQWPVLVILALLADPVVAIMLGAQWSDSVPLVRIVAFTGIVLAPAFMTLPALVATGRVNDTLTAAALSVPISMAGLVIAAQHGPVAVAVALVVAAAWQMGVALFYVRRALGFRWRALARAAGPSVIVTLAAAAVPTAVLIAWGDGMALPILPGILAGIGALPGWLIGIWLTGHPLGGEIRRLAERFIPRLRTPALPLDPPSAAH